MPCIGCYSLDLYCDNESHTIAKDMRYYNVPCLNVIGFNCADCLRQAKLAGWKIKYKTNKCYCPECVKNKFKDTY
jgi:hypothetical protein